MRKPMKYMKVILAICCLYFIVAFAGIWNDIVRFHSRCMVPDAVAVDVASAMAMKFGGSNLKVDFNQKTLLGSEARRELYSAIERDLLWVLPVDIGSSFHRGKTIRLKDSDKDVLYSFLYLCDSNKLMLTEFSGHDVRTMGDNNAKRVSLETGGEIAYDYLSMLMPDHVKEMKVTKVSLISNDSAEVTFAYNKDENTTNASVSARIMIFDGIDISFQNLNPMQFK